MTIGGVPEHPPIFHKPCFINAGLTLQVMVIPEQPAGCCPVEGVRSGHVCTM